MRFFSLVLLSLSLLACESELEPVLFEEGDGSAHGGEGGTSAGDGGGGTAGSGAGGAVEPGSDGGAAHPSEAAWIGVQDMTEGLALDAFGGCEIDAVEWSCSDERGSGFALEAQGIQRNGAEEHPVEPSLGAPDGPCDDHLEECTVPLGLSGWLAFRTAAKDLSGCEITIHEHEDQAVNKYSVYRCSGPNRDPDCRPVYQSNDGPSNGSF